MCNYAGVTVERKEGFVKCHLVVVYDFRFTGAYGLQATSLTVKPLLVQFVWENFAQEVTPDLLVCVVDTTNLRFTFTFCA